MTCELLLKSDFHKPYILSNDIPKSPCTLRQRSRSEKSEAAAGIYPYGIQAPAIQRASHWQFACEDDKPLETSLRTPCTARDGKRKGTWSSWRASDFDVRCALGGERWVCMVIYAMQLMCYRTALS